MSSENIDPSTDEHSETSRDVGAGSGVEMDPDVLRLASGDEAFLAEQFAGFRERLLRTVQFRMDRRLFGRVDADDILQEAYLDGAQRLRHIATSPPPSVFLWLRSITLQTLINVHRRHLGAKIRDANREVSMNVAAGATSVSLAAKLLDSLTSPSLAAIRLEVSGQLEEALACLAEIDREVLALRHFEELTNREVAEVLQIQQKAASVRYVRALGRLQKVLADYPALRSDANSHDETASAEGL